MPEIATAAPPAASPPSPAAPPSAGASSFSDSDAFSALDGLATGGDETPAPEPKPSKPAVQPKAADKAPPKPLEKPADKAPEKPSEKQGEKPAPKPEDFNPEKAGPKQLREAHAKERARRVELEKQIAESKSKPADDSKEKAYQQRVSDAEKRVQELEEELKFSNFEKHPDYAEQYEKPFIAAYTAGRERATRLKAVNADGTNRPGTAADFDDIMKIGDDDAAAERAVELFGNKASLILYHRERTQELNSARSKAVADYRTKGSEREKTRQAERERFQGEVSKEVGGLWKEHVDGAVEKYSAWSKPIDGDVKGNELLEKGYALVDKAFSSFDVMNPNLDKAQRAEMVKAHAAVRNQAAWFPRLAHRHSEALKEIKALKSKLSEFEASVPKGGDGKRGSAPLEEGWESDLQRRVK